MRVISSPFPLPPTDPTIIGKIVKGIGKVVKYAWDVITGKDETQDVIASKKAIDPQKSTADEIAEMNKYLSEYRKSIFSAAEELEREMIVECSMMFQDIMVIYEEYNQKLSISRSETIKRKFSRIGKELKGTFEEYIQRKISLDNEECMKILKLPSGDLKNQRLQELKQKAFIEAHNAIINKMNEAVQDLLYTVEDCIDAHLERAEECVREKSEVLKTLSEVTDHDARTVETVILKTDYLLAMCSYAELLLCEED